MSLQALKNRLTGHSPADDLRHAKDDIKAELKQKGAEVRQSMHNTKERVAGAVHDEAAYLKLRGEQAVQELREKERRVKRGIQQAGAVDSPYFHEVCGEYEATFAQPSLSSKRVVLSTPNLLSFRPGSLLRFSTVHDSMPGNDSIQTNWFSAHTFGPKSVHSPVVKDTKGNPLQFGFDWLRPIQAELKADTTVSIERPQSNTVKLGLNLTDVKSGWTCGGLIKHTGVTGLFAGMFRARMPHVALTGTLKGVGGRGSSDQIAMGAVSSTLYRDESRDSTVSAGVQLQSAKFNSKLTQMPNSIDSVTAKIEYDEPAYNVDASVKAVAFTDDRTNDSSIKIASAWLRGLYCTNLGQYPRSAFGAAVGLTHVGDNDDEAAEGDTSAAAAWQGYGDFDSNGSSDAAWRRVLLSNERLSQLDNPVASASFYHALNINNKIKFRVSSTRQVSSSFSYFLTPGVSLQASLTTHLPSWDASQWYSGAGVKNVLGLAVNIVAD